MTHGRTLGFVALTLTLGLAGWMTFAAGRPAIAPAAAAAAPPDLQDLIGGRASAGEGAFRQRGFVLARLRGLTAYWWQPSSERCVRSETTQGLYRSLDPVAASTCWN
ncbi:hypothetical protein KPL78_05940 [Roseomonas sp. HJA6]|uniref:Uncharacterized protein n=1 Tax=Roseomonas alba TaxID=2846776 RepID=A0ABS7A6J3_9PROT|nr:hypothetical protein [Neoroseomonas alba]MBW6397382.1 hypothetical protein [Neoroseomonas alba]